MIQSQTSRGFSLLEVLIALAILSITIVAVMSILDYVVQGQAQDKFMKQTENLHEEVRAFLSSPANCVKTFDGIASVGTGDIAMDKLRDFTNASIYTVGQRYGDNAVILNTLTFNPGTAGASGVTSGNGRLVFNYKRGTMGIGQSDVTRTIDLRIEKNVSTNVITECIAYAKMTDGIWRRSLADQKDVFFGTGGVGVGTTNPTAQLHITQQDGYFPQIQIEASKTFPVMRMVGIGTVHPDFDFIRLRDPSAGTGYALNGDYMGQLTYRTRGAAISAEIVAQATEDHTGSAAGASLSFRTSANGSNIQATRLQITGLGDVRLYADAFPSADINFDLGSAARRFRDIYTQSLYSNNGVTVPSDGRLKKDIQELDLGLDFINSLRPVSYQYKKGDARTHYGFIAQELEEKLQERSPASLAIVSHDNSTDRLGVNYHELIAPLTKAIQELSAENARLRERVERLERERSARP